MLWVDKYRPKTLEDVELYPEQTTVLKRLAASRDVPHLLFYGPSGSGKKTRAMAVLQEVYGPSVLSVKLEHKSIQVNASKVVEIATLSSPHHIDINPSDAGNYDRVIIMQMIREIAQTAPIPSASGHCVKFKMIILNEVDKMSRGAQHALRRTMEKYMATCRLVLLCTSTSRLIPALRSRCLSIRVPGHTKENVEEAVRRVAKHENRPVPSPEFISTLFERCEGNLRRALLMYEAAVMMRVDVSGNGAAIPQPDWKLYIDEIAGDVIAEQTPSKLHEVRTKFYDLLGQCISGETILRTLLESLMAMVGRALVMPLVRLAAQYDHHMKLGTRPIFHLEAFVAGVMKLLKQQSSVEVVS